MGSLPVLELVCDSLALNGHGTITLQRQNRGDGIHLVVSASWQTLSERAYQTLRWFKS